LKHKTLKRICGWSAAWANSIVAPAETQNIERQWDKSMRWFNGKQEPAIRGDRKAVTVTNIVFAQIMTILPILANREPRISLTQLDGDKNEKTYELERIITRVIRRNDFIAIQTRAVFNALLFGSGYFKTGWDRTRLRGLGDIAIMSPPTANMLFSAPDGRLENANWIMEARELDRATALRLYPNARALINKVFRTKSIITDRKNGVPDTEITSYLSQGIGTASSPNPTLTTSTPVQEMHKIGPRLTFIDCLIRDEETVEVIESDADPGRPVKKYATGRLISFIKDTNVKLDDRPNPYTNFPYARVMNYDVPGHPYGVAETTHLMPVQKQFNVRMNQIVDQMNFANNKMMFVERRSGLDASTVTTAPGGIYQTIQNSGIKIEDWGQPSTAAFQMVTIYQRFFEMISGVREVTQGEVHGDVRSGFAVQQLQEAAQTRLRLKTRFLEQAVRDVVRHIIDLVGIAYLPGKHYNKNVNLKGSFSELYDIDVRSGVNLPSSRVAEQQMVQWAFSQGIADEEYVVKSLDLDEPDSLIERMRPIWDAKRQAIQAQAQQVAAQAEGQQGQQQAPVAPQQGAS